MDTLETTYTAQVFDFKEGGEAYYLIETATDFKRLAQAVSSQECVLINLTANWMDDAMRRLKDEK